MILILINIPVMDVVNRDTSRLSVLTMRARKNMISKDKREENPRNLT